MLDQRWVRLYRVLFGMLTFAAVGYQLWTGAQREIWNPVNFFSFFTIQSNLIAAVVLVVGALPERERISVKWTALRVAATMYMVTTGIVYALLLSGLEESLQTPTPWVNSVLHQVMPIVMVLDLVIRLPARELTMRTALTWLIFPAIWLVYTLLRGPVVDWYPYPFVDPRNNGGYPLVALYCVAILLGFLALSALIIRLLNRARTSPVASPGTAR